MSWFQTLSDTRGEKMSSLLQSGDAGWNRQRLAVTGRSASVVGLGSAFFLCQTVFWHRPCPHILPTVHGHRVWHSLKVSHRVGGKRNFSLMLFPSTNFLLLLSVLLWIFSGVVSWQQCWKKYSDHLLKVAVPRYKNIVQKTSFLSWKYT